MRRLLVLSFLSFSSMAFGCVVSPEAGDDEGSASGDSEAIQTLSDGTAWYHLDSTSGTADATLSAVNGGKIRCGDGKTRTTCHVAKLTLPKDCDWECQDGVLSLRGETVLRGKFSGNSFVASAGFDTWTKGLGSEYVYRITASSTCLHDPCPTGMKAQRLNSSSKAKTVASIDFSKANDTNYVLDPTRGYAQVATDAGLVVSGHFAGSVFRADRVWRLWTPKPACDVDLTARNYALAGGEGITAIELLTVAEAERYVDPAGASVHWLVRTADDAARATFTSGIADLWAQRFEVSKSSCAIVVVAEH
jgi:hypothetical protein